MTTIVNSGASDHHVDCKPVGGIRPLMFDDE